MIPNESNLLKLAKQGNPNAIATLINCSLQPKGITAKASISENCLQILLESNQVPDKQALTTFVTRGIANLKIETIKTLRIFGKQKGEDLPA